MLNEGSRLVDLGIETAQPVGERDRIAVLRAQHMEELIKSAGTSSDNFSPGLAMY